MSQYDQRCAEVRGHVHVLKIRRTECQRRIDTHAARVDALEEQHRVETAAADMLAVVEAQAKEQVRNRVERVVAGALTAVLEREYGARVEFSERAGRPQAKLLVIRNGSETDPLEGSGGGVVDIVSAVLRAAYVMHTQPALRRLLVLDEPFRHVARAHSSGVGYLLRELAEKGGLTVLIVTHSEAVAEEAHQVYRAEMNDGVTSVFPMEKKLED